MDRMSEIILAVVASQGLWNLLQWLLSNIFRGKDAKSDMLIGLGHDRIVYLGTQYIKRGYVTKDEFENLNDYLFVPYKKLGGNGTAEKVMEDVKRLPMKG